MSRRNPFRFRRPTGWTFYYPIPASKRYPQFSIIGQDISRWYGLHMALSMLFAKPQFRPRLVSRTLPARLSGLRFPDGNTFLGVYQDNAEGNRFTLRLDWPTPDGMQDVIWQLRELGFVHVTRPHAPVFAFSGLSGATFIWDEAHVLVVGYDGGVILQLAPDSGWGLPPDTGLL